MSFIIYKTLLNSTKRKRNEAQNILQKLFSTNTEFNNSKENSTTYIIKFSVYIIQTIKTK